MNEIRVAIIEDNDPLRTSLQKMVERFEDCICVGTFADGRQALTGLPACQPRVVLMDINLPHVGGIECVAKMKDQLPNTEFIMLTVYEDSDTIFRALEAGASGYLLKRAEPADLHAAIRQVHEGGAPMDSHIARKVVQVFRKPAKPTPAPKDDLSARERQVLELLAQGLLYKEIATSLGISYATVNNHVRHIYEKLHVQSRAQAIARYKG
jgi:DNA-binding NarL/FixJ family response regulator